METKHLYKRRIKNFFFCLYFTSNMLLLCLQIIFVTNFSKPIPTVKVMISGCGLFIFCLNFIMAFRFKDIYLKFLLLLNNNEPNSFR